jgi:hypothetical protein
MTLIPRFLARSSPLSCKFDWSGLSSRHRSAVVGSEVSVTSFCWAAVSAIYAVKLRLRAARPAS